MKIAAVCLQWAGIVVGISFIEAPAKFGAPTLSYPVALDVGRTVFAASHQVQLGLAALLAGGLALVRPRRAVWLVAGAVVAVLAIQHVGLLPALDARARVVIGGGTPAGGSPHVVFVVLEVLKLAGLLLTSRLASS